MEDREWRWIDKSAWARGDWDDEPDKAQWTDEAARLPCLFRRNPHSGFLCGYVGIPPTHPWFKIAYGSCARPSACPGERTYCDHQPDVKIDVHGDLTFSESCNEEDPEHGICHVGGAFEPAWWFGFDCGHSNDLSPNRPDWYGPPCGEIYRDAGYVKRECAKLAAQLAAVAQGA